MPCWPMPSRPFDDEQGRCCDPLSAYFVWNIACAADNDTFEEQEEYRLLRPSVYA